MSFRLSLLLCVVLVAAGARSVQAQPEPGEPGVPASAPTSQPAAAQPLAPGPDLDKQRAKQLFSQAEADYRLGKMDKALAGYKAALALWKHPSIIYNVAQCYRHKGDLKQALFFYKLFLADWVRFKPGTTPANEAEVNNHIKALKLQIEAAEERARLAAITAEQERRAQEREKLRLAILTKQRAAPKVGKIRIKGLDIGQARVLIDSDPRGISPLVRPLEVKPGKHQVRVEAKGYLTWIKVVKVEANKEVTVKVDLAPIPRKSRLWLATFISSLVLAAGAEGLAWYYFTQGMEHYEGTLPYKEDKDTMVVWHAVAGGLAAVSLTSLILYSISGGGGEQEQPASAGFMPLPGGGAAVGQFRF